MAKKPKETMSEEQITDVQIDTPEGTANVEAKAEPVVDQGPVSGRAVFAVSRVDVGVAVHTAFLAEDGRLLQMPAVFPNLEYALQQVDEMRQMLINQFAAS